MKAQDYLDKHYPKAERWNYNGIIDLTDVTDENLEGTLDLTLFSRKAIFLLDGNPYITEVINSRCQVIRNANAYLRRYNKEERKKIKKIDVSGFCLRGVCNIEGFEELEEFYCKGNLLSKIIISGGSERKLKELDCSENQITELHLNGSQLLILDCSDNQINKQQNGDFLLSIETKNLKFLNLDKELIEELKKFLKSWEKLKIPDTTDYFFQSSMEIFGSIRKKEERGEVDLVKLLIRYQIFNKIKKKEIEIERLQKKNKVLMERLSSFQIRFAELTSKLIKLDEKSSLINRDKDLSLVNKETETYKEEMLYLEKLIIEVLTEIQEVSQEQTSHFFKKQVMVSISKEVINKEKIIPLKEKQKICKLEIEKSNSRKFFSTVSNEEKFSRVFEKSEFFKVGKSIKEELEEKITILNVHLTTISEIIKVWEICISNGFITEFENDRFEGLKIKSLNSNNEIKEKGYFFDKSILIEQNLCDTKGIEKKKEEKNSPLLKEQIIVDAFPVSKDRAYQ